MPAHLNNNHDLLQKIHQRRWTRGHCQYHSYAKRLNPTSDTDEDTRSRNIWNMGSDHGHSIAAHAACPATVGLCDDEVSCR